MGLQQVDQVVTPLEFNEKSKAEIQKHLKKYPDRGAALLPTLYIAQAQFGYISPSAMALIARTLDLPETRVREVATWYTMFNKKPVGKYHVQMCTNISCHLLGADSVFEGLCQTFKVKKGETTSDGKFTFQEVECLASCGSGPCMQVNDDYYEHLSLEAALAILNKLP